MMQPEQLLLPLPVRRLRGRADFFVSPANERALARIEDWTTWPDQRLILSGPTSSGKSHLAAIWAASAEAGTHNAQDLTDLPPDGPFLIEDVDKIAGDAAREEALFHLWNRRHPLLLTGTGSPARWGIALPDLTSRLLSMEHVALDVPDDRLLAAVLVKHFEERQLIVTPTVITQMTRHMERSLCAAERLVAELDRESLRLKRRITSQLVSEVLRKHG